ncbi:MAG: hypothetical protein AB1486_23465 [Planctomycetota bacterium]
MASSRYRPMRVFLLLGIFAASACEEEDVVSIRLAVSNDLSGTIACSTLLIPAESGPLEKAGVGIDWNNRATLVCAAGSFASLSRLQLEDISFSASDAAAGIRSIRVILPRGPAARWPRTVAPSSAAERERAARTFDASGRWDRIGAVLKLVIDLPGNVVGHGVSLRARGIKEAADLARATLIVPLDVAATEGMPLVWHLTWEG